jgi:transcriptional regulator of acetoin/glycerol metabolism
MTALKSREWSGNIRELVNVIECMCFMSSNETLTIDDLPDGYRLDEEDSNNQVMAPGDLSQPLCSLDYAERKTIEAAVKQSEGNMTKAAKVLGIAKSTLYQKMKKYGIEKE